MQSPEPFAGELEKCTGFLTQLSLFFASRAYASDDAWIAFFAQLLWDHALQKTHLNISYPKFLFKFKGGCQPCGCGAVFIKSKARKTHYG